MSKTTLMKEVIVTAANKVGSLSKVITAFAESKVNIEGCCCYVQDKQWANLHFVTSDPGKTESVCKNNGWTWKENPIVCCELSNKVGTLAEATHKLAEAGVDIQYCYTSTGNGAVTKVFFSTNDDNKAAQTLG